MTGFQGRNQSFYGWPETVAQWVEVLLGTRLFGESGATLAMTAAPGGLNSGPMPSGPAGKSFCAASQVSCGRELLWLFFLCCEAQWITEPFAQQVRYCIDQKIRTLDQMTLSFECWLVAFRLRLMCCTGSRSISLACCQVAQAFKSTGDPTVVPPTKAVRVLSSLPAEAHP